MPLNAGDTVRVAIRQRGPQGQDIVNVIHYQADAAIASSDAEIMDAIVATADVAYAYLNYFTPSTQRPLDVRADVVKLQGGQIVVVRPLGTRSWGFQYDPKESGNVYAPTIAAGVLLRTLAPRVLGKKFIGALMETHLYDYGHLSPQLMAALAQYAARLLMPILLEGGSLRAGVLSKKIGQFVRFVEYEIKNVPFVLRRRRLGIGR